MGAPIELYCQLAPDYLPDPQSCLITGITPQRCQERGLPEFEFARRIEAELSQEGTIGVGYNTIRFDDEVTRHLFWRNLIDPYSREWRNHCGRWDILDLVRATYALRPEGIEWPTVSNDNGESRVSMRLELLTAANGIAHEAAHDALSDVRATMALARLIKQKQPKLFDFYFKLHKKENVLKELGLPASAQQLKPFLHISGMFPVEHGCLGVMFPLATHPVNKNEIIAWDLTSALSPGILTQLNDEEISLRLFSKQDALPSDVPRLPIKTIHLNKSPFVLSHLGVLTPELQKKWAIDLERCWLEAQVARDLPDMSAIWKKVFQPFKKSPDLDLPSDVDEALYDGFVSDHDRRTLAQLIQQASKSPQQLGERVFTFADARLGELVWRFRARNFPQTLSAQEMHQWRAHCQSRLIGGAQQAQTLEVFNQKLDELQANVDKASQGGNAVSLILQGLRAYGQFLSETCR